MEEDLKDKIVDICSTSESFKKGLGFTHWEIIFNECREFHLSKKDVIVKTLFSEMKYYFPYSITKWMQLTCLGQDLGYKAFGGGYSIIWVHGTHF